MSRAWNQLAARRFTSPRLLLRAAVARFVLALCLSGSAEAGAPARAAPVRSAARRVEHADIPQELREAIEKSRYWIREQERASRAPGYRCSNPGQDFEASFSRAGLDVRPGGVSVGPGAWRMSLRGYGYGERMQPVAAAKMTVRDNRIEYQRGPLTEWYVNERSGLEQGFTLSAPPQGPATGEALVLRLGVSGALRAVLQADGEQVAFVDADDKRLVSYSQLAAFDARGRRLPARMRLARDEVRLEVDERGAAYPVTIDPLIATEQAKLTASDAGVDDEFGLSVALSGDTALVGAPLHDTAGGPSAGSAYVYALRSDSCVQVNLGDYNLFVLGDYPRGTDVAGKVAAGGNITLNNFSVGHGLPANDIYSANTTVVYPRGAASRNSPIDFTARGQQLRALSTQLGSLPSNGTTTVTSWGGLMLRGTNPQLNVFQVKASDLSNTVLLSIEAPGGSLAVLNITGSTATLRGGHEFSGGIDAQGVLFNFVEATAIMASSYGLSGTLLAPGARVDFSNGSFDGGIYALSMTGNAAGHILPLRSGSFCQ